MSSATATAHRPGIVALPTWPGADLAVWLVDLEQYAVGQDWRMCSPAERAQAARLRGPGHAQRHLAGRHALRCILSDCTGQPPDTLNYRFNQFGKPLLADGSDLHFNLSRSQAWALVGIRERGPIGVDIECHAPTLNAQDIALAHCSEAEYREWQGLATADQSEGFLRAWTRKEASLKALGTGLSIAPKDMDVGCDKVARQPTLSLGGHRVELQVSDVHLGPNVLAAVASCHQDMAEWAQSLAPAG